MRDGLGASPPPSSRAGSLVLEQGMMIGNGRYELLSRLGQGGMAEVWRAMHVPLRTEVAIKFVSASLTYDPGYGQEALERFRLEAQLSARLGARSRNIVTVHDADTHQDRPYLVMELLDGRTLGDLIDQGPLPVEQLADVLDQIAEGLDAAHSAGVLHRDLKPSNILLTPDAQGRLSAKIADFGVAKVLSGSLQLERPKATVQGQLIGTAAYMSPEQVDGRHEIDARSDLWSLGVVMYEAMTGDLPFDRPTFTATMAAISVGTFEPPSHLRPDLPASIDAWCARALAQSREARFSSAHEMAAAFRAALAGARPANAPGACGATSTPGRLGRAGLLALIVLGALGLLGLFVLAVLFLGPSTDPEAPPDPAPPVLVLPSPDPTPPVAPQIAPQSPAPHVTATPLPHPAPPPIQPTAAPTAQPTAAPTAQPTAPEPPPVSAPAPSPPPAKRPRKKIDPSEIQ